MTGGLRKRAHSYLNMPSATVADRPLSFNARGILAYLLDKPAGWDVRSVAIAADSPDGKAAVQAGLRELARAGYYRIERRRMLDGRLAVERDSGVRLDYLAERHCADLDTSRARPVLPPNLLRPEDEAIAIGLIDTVFDAMESNLNLSYARVRAILNSSEAG